MHDMSTHTHPTRPPPCAYLERRAQPRPRDGHQLLQLDRAAADDGGKLGLLDHEFNRIRPQRVVQGHCHGGVGKARLRGKTQVEKQRLNNKS